MAKTCYTETSDLNSIETDAANLTAKLFERFVHVPQIISMVSAHLNDGKPVPGDLFERLVKRMQTSTKVFIIFHN
jgi:Zn-dependent oligopeptidase